VCPVAGRKRYSDALQLLLQALTAPTMVVNAITMTCYKLYVLVSLIYTGISSPPPPFNPYPDHSLLTDRIFTNGMHPPTLSYL